MDEITFIRLAAFLLLVSTLINLILLARIQLLNHFVKFTAIGTFILNNKIAKLETQKQNDTDKLTEQSNQTTDRKVG